MANYPDNKKDDTDFEDVYAGPEFFGVDDEPKDGLHGEEKKEKKPEPPQDEFVCVYAGPEYFGVKEEDPDTAIEVEPEEDPAAPEPEDEPEQPEEKPEEKAEDEAKIEEQRRALNAANLKQFEAVYAGPQYYQNQYMMAYAGPQQMNNGGRSLGFMSIMSDPNMMNQQQQNPPEPQKKICDKCGAEMPKNANFCGKCGNKLSVVCPGCGAHNPPNSKFCTECGTLLK